MGRADPDHPQGGLRNLDDPLLNYNGDPRLTKQGRALEATVEEARRAGATNAEIAEAAAGQRAAPAPAAAPDEAATHKDPGEPAEPVTPTVIAEAIQTAAENRDRNPSELKADALRLIDEAIARAPSEADVLAQIGVNEVKTVRGKKEFTAVRSFDGEDDRTIVVNVREDIAKLQDQSAANDYLANVVDEKVWNLSEEARATFFGEQAVETYPYPGQAELPAVRAAFDEFFKTVEIRTDDAGNVAMFSRTPDSPDASDDGIITVTKLPYNELWVVSRKAPNGSQHVGYYPSESEANAAADRARFTVNRTGGRKPGQWWIADNLPSDDRAVPVGSAGGSQLDPVGRARAAELTRAARSSAVQSIVEGGGLKQVAENAGDCFGLATEASIAGIGDYVVGIYDSAQGPLWHAVVKDADGYIYDPTFHRWFAPGVYEELGFEPRMTVKPGQVRKFVQESGGRIVSPFTLGLTDARGNSLPDNGGSFSRPDFATTQFGSRRPMVQAVVDAIRAGWKNAPPVQVVRDMDDERIPAAVREADQAQRSQGASGSPAGFFYDGKVYLVADQIASEAEARRVFWHESLGHFGLRGVFGADLSGILDQIIKARPADLRAKMRQYGLSDTLAGRRYAAEELLAEMAQERPEIGFVKRAIAAIRAWLKRQGFDLGLSDNDIIANFILPARDYVERGAAQMQGSPAPVFTRSAINQYAADRAQGRDRVLIRRDGTVMPLVGIDSVDRQARDGEVIAQRNVGKQEWTVLSSGQDLSKGQINRALASIGAEAMMSRSPAAALSAGLDHPHDIIRRMAPDGIRQAMIDAATSQRGFNRWWHRTVGTQLHKAKINKHFARVYDAVQAYLRDVSGVAHIASDKAATLLPRNDSLGKVFTRPPKAADLKAASEAVFDGTLKDEKVYSDAELREKGLTDAQIGYYREFRAAVDQSLDNLVASDTIRLLTTQSPELLGRNATDSGAAMARLKELAASENPGMVREEVNRLIGQRLADLDAALSGQPNQHTPDLQTKRDRAAQVLDDINDKFDIIEKRKREGYAPLTRFGPYTVDVTSSSGERLFFSRYESQKAANEDARRFLAAGLQVRQGMLSQEEFKLLKGMTPETAILFAEMAGLDRTEAMEAFLREGVAQHSALKRYMRRKGIAGYSPDMQRVLAAFITSSARATSSNLHALETNEALDSIPQSAGDVKDEAVNLVRYVQEPAEEAQAIRSLMFINYIGGSVASALVNMTQTLVQTYPYLSQFGGAGKAMGRVSRAMTEALAGAKLDDDLAQALARAEKDGIVKPQELFELQAEASRNFGSNQWVRKGVAVWGSLFQIAEQYNRRVAFIAAYRTAKEEGMADPFAFAEGAVEETQGVFNKGNRPDWARGAVGATLFTFKGFTIQYIEFLKRLPPKERALALGILFLLAGAQGIPFADDADDIIDTVAQALGYNFVSKVERQRFLENAVGKDWAEFLQRGVSGIAGVPFDVSQRLGLGNLLPGTAVLKKSEPRREDQVLEVLGVAGSYARDALRGEFRPIAVRNAAAAIDMYQTGAYRDRDGRRVTGVDGTDAALKAIGLQPATVAEDSRITGRNYEQRALYRNAYEDIHKDMARAMFENDDGAKRDVRERLRDWNRKNPEAKISLSIPSLRRRVQQMKMDRSERFAKATPKAIRPLLEGQE